MKKTIKRRDPIMEGVLKNLPVTPLKQGDLIEGVVLENKSGRLFINIRPCGTGVVYGREYNSAREIIKTLKTGDTVTAKITELENKEGYIELSLNQADKEIVWQEAQVAQKNQEVFQLPILEANKGGLIMEWKGITGFLPASQLKTAHYPRVEGGDKDKILEELKKLIGTKISVIVLDSNQKENKLIFSEKESESGETKEKLSKYKVGDVVDGEITGVVNFGVFMKIEDGLEGLAHISELDWSLVSDPADMFKVGEKIPAQIISIKDGKISLSIKALKFNPWENAKNKYKKGDMAKGIVIKFNKYGALVSIEEGVAGLVHISEFGSEEEMKKNIELGKSYDFRITLFEPEEQRLIMAFVKSGSEAEQK